jgi:hypothetical protein
MEAAIYEQLSAACFSTSLSEQEAAMRSLKELEEGHGTHNALPLITVLASCINNDAANIRDEIRLLASICLKNLVLRSWVRLDEACRSAMWQFVHRTLEKCENNSKIAAQTAVLTAKMCRREWPNDLVTKQLFPYLFSLLTDRSNWRRQTQTIKAIDEILSEISSMKLPPSRVAFAALSVEAFPVVLTIWTELSSQLCEGLLPGMAELPVESLHKNSWGALVMHLESVMSVMQQLLAVGYESLSATRDMNSFFGALVQTLTLLSGFCQGVFSRVEDEEDLADDFNAGVSFEDTEAFSMSLLAIAHAVKGLVSGISGLVPEIQREYPLLVVPLLIPFLGYAHAQLVTTYSSPTAGVFSEPLVLSCITILSGILSCGSYSADDITGRPKSIARRLNSGSRTSLEDDALAAKSGFRARASFFDDGRVGSLVGLLLHYILYPSKRELTAWEEDPEDFYGNQQGVTTTESVRVAGEGLMLALLDHSSELVSGRLLAAIRDREGQTQLLQGRCSEAEVIFWSNAFLCSGLAAYKLERMFDATDWFSQSVGPLISAQLGRGSGRPQVLLFRCVWLCGCWAHAVAPALLPPMVDLFVAVLDRGSMCDAAVVLQTIDTLTSLLENTSLASAVLVERLLRLVEVLCPLASSLAESESQSRVVELLSALMGAAGPRLRPLLAPLAMHLQSLWLGSEPSSPLKLALVQALISVVRAAGEASVELHSLLVPVLLVATSGSEQSSFLAEEGVNLWLTVLRNSGAYSPHLDELFRVGMSSLLAAELVPLADVEKARVLMQVVEAYAILGGRDFLTSCAQNLKQLLDQSLCRVLPRVVGAVVRPIETMLLVCPAEAAVFLLQSGALTTLLRPCAAAVPSLATHFEDHLETDVALVSYLSVCARLVIVAPTVLQQATSALCGDDGRPLLHGVVRLLIDKFDAAGYSSSGVWRRRLWCVAVMAMYMYPTGDSPLLDWLPEVLVICDDVAAEQAVEEAQEGAGLLYTQDSDDVLADPLSLTFNRIVAADGVTTVSIRRLVGERMDVLRQALGNAAFEELMRRVEPAAIQRLRNKSRASSPVPSQHNR